MAWRINEAVVRGEFDNRMRGRVTGRIWFVGRADPVTLELKGNCWRAGAGRRLEFSNPEPKPGDIGKLAARQQGVVGDITASRKVKVPEIPLEQIGEYYAAKKPWPWHWGNSLYLEWFSERNGRVVIETASFDLKIVGEAVWEMSPAEEEEQRRANAEAMGGFMEQIGEAVAREKAKEEEPAEWDERPQTEAEAEQMQERSDRLTDRIQARLVREGKGADYEKILHEEIERMREEHGEPEPTPEQLARNAEWIEEMNRAGEEALNDPELQKELDQKHPLAERAFELSLRLCRAVRAGRWVPAGASPEHPVAELEGAVMGAGAKLAGALNGCEWPPLLDASAGVIVRLKRARAISTTPCGQPKPAAKTN
ncbi:MAG: hypothetical protein HYX71_06005 [Opitutae bacterium]|nr:hypothetical protein [Opitutae bacterium]